MGILMESLCYYRDCKSFFLFCYFICIHARQFDTSLDYDCHRNYMLRGCFDRSSTYSSTSALMPSAGYLEDTRNTTMVHMRIDIPIPVIIEALIVVVNCSNSRYITAVLAAPTAVVAAEGEVFVPP
jgi:hypothetical protein